MAQNITLLGASYSDVPAVTLPKTGGGTARFDDASITTATASDVATGKVFLAPDGTITTGTNSGGGGGGSATKKQINFIDYDGTIVDSYTASEWASVTSLPSNPSHTGLTAQGWNWTKAQIDAQLTALPNGDVWVGQMYITASGDTEIDVVMHEGRLSPIMSLPVNGTITVDWGDGTTVDTVTGTSITTPVDVPHTYAYAGAYTITIHVVSGSFRFSNPSTNTLLRKNTTLNENKVYANCIKATRIGNGISSIYSYAFSYCTSLEYITIPSAVTQWGNNAFDNCSSLVSVTVPNGVTTISGYSFRSNASLASVSIPSGITSIGNYAFATCSSLASVTIPNISSLSSNSFSNCSSLASVVMPDSITSMGVNAFNNCFSLATITIPSGIAIIQNGAFNNCLGMKEYHLLPTTPPSIANPFGTMPSDCIIYVPSASLEAYQTATNWSTYASYMQGE